MPEEAQGARPEGVDLQLRHPLLQLVQSYGGVAPILMLSGHSSSAKFAT